MHLHLLSLPHAGTSGAAPLAVPGPQRIPVLHRVRLVATLNAGTHAGVDAHFPPQSQMHPVAQCGRTASSIRAATPVSSDGVIEYRRFGQPSKGGNHARLATSAGEQPRVNPCAALPGVNGGARTNISIMRRQDAGRLINQPQGGFIGVAQVESRTYRMADNVRSMRRSHLRIASRDGVVDAEELALDDQLVRLGDELEQKADDERAAFALIRIGRTKHTRGIVVDLFPSIGPEAA